MTPRPVGDDNEPGDLQDRRVDDDEGAAIRKLITLGALLALLLTACSGGATSVEEEAAAGGDAQPASSEAAGSEDAPEAATVDCEVGEVDGELVFYNWTEYMDPELISKFKDEFGVDVVEDFYPSNEEMLARVQGGGSGFDVIVPSDYMVGIMIEEGLLLQLDKSAILNAGNVAEDFMAPPYDPKLAFSMPYQWGTTGLGVNTADVGEDPEPTWGWIFDPKMSRDLHGQMSMLDDPRSAMGAALSYLGYSMNSTNEDELREAADLIAEATDRIAAFDSDQFEDLLISGETAIAHGYSGDFFTAFAAAENADDFAYLIPKEGAIRWVDNMAVLADAPHPCTAHTFLNFILDARNGAQLTNWNYYGSPNTPAEAFIDTEILEDPAIYPPDDVVAKLEILEDTGDTEPLYTELFTEAKS